MSIMKIKHFEYSKLEEVSAKVGDQKSRTMKDYLMNVIDSESIQQEIKGYFDDIQKACSECQVSSICCFFEIV